MHRTFLKRFPLFIWLLFAVSSVSNFRPHTGGRRFSSVLLRGGRALQTDIAVCGEHSPCSGHTGFAPYRGVCDFPSTLLRLLAALYGAGPVLSAVPVFRSSTKARTRLHLRFVSSPASAVQAARGLGSLSPDVARLFPLWPQPAPAVGCLRFGLFSGTGLSPRPSGWRMSTIQNLRNSLDRNQRPVCCVGGRGFSGAEFAPFP